MSIWVSKEALGPQEAANHLIFYKIVFRANLDIDTTKGEWGFFEDGWAGYDRMTGLEDVTAIRVELRASCTPAWSR